jgi:hypothetical protein
MVHEKPMKDEKDEKGIPMSHAISFALSVKGIITCIGCRSSPGALDRQSVCA